MAPSITPRVLTVCLGVPSCRVKRLQKPIYIYIYIRRTSPADTQVEIQKNSNKNLYIYIYIRRTSPADIHFLCELGICCPLSTDFSKIPTPQSNRHRTSTGPQNVRPDPLGKPRGLLNATGHPHRTPSGMGLRRDNGLCKPPPGFFVGR